jgi:hypothetical protein
MVIQRLSRIVVIAFAFLAGILSSSSCKETTSSPTAPGNATVTGTVVLGDETSGTSTRGMGIGLAGVTVRAVRTGQSTQTDSSGNFTVTGVPAGDQEFEFSRGDMDARGTIPVVAGATTAVTVAISRRSTVVVVPRGNAPQTPPPQTPRGNAVEEIEGLVSATGAGTLTIQDQRLGVVVVKVTATTIIRKGGTIIPLSQILIGMRVHVKALIESDGSFTATEIVLQNENTRTVTPATPEATNTPTMTPVPPTATHTPTATPAPPTATDTPTATHTPTVTPT